MIFIKIYPYYVVNVKIKLLDWALEILSLALTYLIT